MQAVGRLGSYITRGVCTVSGPFLPFGGAVDIIVVQQKDGSFKSTPWYVRFGKFQRVLKAKEREKVEVNISVNGVEPDFHMCLNNKGEAFFLHAKTQEQEEDEDQDEGEGEFMWPYDFDDDIQLKGNMRQLKSKSCNFDSGSFRSDAHVVDKVVARSGSRRWRLLGRVFGPRFGGDDADTNGVDSRERAEVAARLLELKWSTNLTFNELHHRNRRKNPGDNLDNGLNPGKTSEKACSCNEQDGINSRSDFDEVSCLTRARSGAVHVQAEVLDSTTLLLPEVEKTEGASKIVDCGMLVRDSGIYDVADVGSIPKFRKSQTVNIGRRDHSAMQDRANAPTSEQLESLNLKEGRNTVTFSFSTPMMGRRQIDARIFLWKWNTRIVISDVDGTITRSDVLGQFMPLVGIDWSQTGVAHLFSEIKENGYQLLFLSARAISQAYYTRQFLFNLKQDGKVLPDGPVVISPDGLFPSLYREVIRRAPHEFKITCLEDIKALFPPDYNPFYAGFGNRDTDEISYLKVGIPKSKIFIINPRGEIAVNRRFLDTKSYTALHALVNGVFPPSNSSEQEDFNSWNYWKLPSDADL